MASQADEAIELMPPIREAEEGIGEQPAAPSTNADSESTPAEAASTDTHNNNECMTEILCLDGLAERENLAGFFPQIDSDEHNSWRIWISRRSQALLLQIGLITVILAANLGLTIFSYTRYDSDRGVGLIYGGSCSRVKRLDQWLHLLINLLSTGMLSASNYCMQLQAAPTRAKIDEAHNSGKWLDIGIPSLRNFGYLGRWRQASWLLLAFSSIPIHLIYNSAVFQSLSSHNYTVAVVKDSFLDGSSWDLGTAEANRAGDPAWDEGRVNPRSLNYTDVIQNMQQEAHTYKNLTLAECFDLYNSYWTPQGNAIILVRNQSVQMTAGSSLLMYVSIIPRSDDWGKNMWALGNGTGTFIAKSPVEPIQSWYLGPPKYAVSHCLVRDPQELQTKCRFEYSPIIMFVICAMNMIKWSVMLCIWALGRYQSREVHQDNKEVLYTLGDAIASFMRKPDRTTRDMGMATKHDFLSKRSWGTRFTKRRPEFQSPPPARRFEKEKRQWRHAASLQRWIVLVVLWLAVMTIASILLGRAFVSLKHRRFSTKIPSLWDLGFGALTPFTYLVIGLPTRDPWGLFANVLVANIPQLILSILYIVYNTMLSTFLVQREFSRMCETKYRKTLRVSEPIGIQRSSYFISLPLRFGIPLYTSSGIIHWLISQSFFLARITAISADGTDDKDNSFSTCGYSPIAIFVTLLVGIFMLVCIVAMSFCPYDGTMRMVSTNSRAISAACHVLEKDREAGYLFTVQWGVVRKENVGEDRVESKCAFTTAPTDKVRRPEEGDYCK